MYAIHGLTDQIEYKVDQCVEGQQLYELKIRVFPTLQTNTYTKKKKYNKHSSGEAAEKCVNLLVNNFNCDEFTLRNNTANIYCPFHENPTTSNSASGRFRFKSRKYICYSSLCPVGNVTANQLLVELLKKINS